MIVSPVKPDDYEELAGWWKAWGWDAIPQIFLPPTGLMVSKDGKNICAAFLYKTDTALCYVENYISCKDATREDRDEALSLLLETMTQTAKDFGFAAIMTGVKHNNLSRRLESHGFIKSDDGMTHFIKGL